jgi:ATP-binding cassette, subfamily B, bacterial PglK
LFQTSLKIWRLLDSRARLEAFGLLALMLASSLLEGVGVGIVLPLLTVLVDPTSIEKQRWLASIYGWTGADTITSFAVMLCLGLFGTIVLKSIVGLITVRSQFGFVWENRARLSVQLLERYLAAPYVTHLQRNSAELTRNVTASTLEIFVGTVLPALLLASESLAVLVLLAILMLADPLATLAVTLGLGGMMAVLQLIIRRRLREVGEITHDTNQSVLRAVGQALGGVREAKIFSRETWFLDSFRSAVVQNSLCRRDYTVLAALPRIILEPVALAAVLGAIGVAFLSQASAAHIVPLIGLYAAAAIRLIPIANRIVGHLASIRFNSAALDQISAELTESLPRPQPVPMTDRLDLRRVSYRFPGAAEDALRDADFSIGKGESVGLVGPSGAGKTTLVNVILGLLEPTEGARLVDGVAIDSIRSRLAGAAYVPQDTFLLDDTLTQNIVFASRGAPIDRAHLCRVIEHAQLADLVASLPQGLDTVIGERGSRLSGGERQRVGLARALYARARLLVLDEATSALDATTEEAVADMIGKLQGEISIIVIAHRLSTVRRCDRIVFMNGGRTTDVGNFSGLFERNPDFRKMVETMREGLSADAGTVL